jgi:hypothetical protein
MEVGKGTNPADSGDLEVPHTDTGHAFAGNNGHCGVAVEWPERDGRGDAKVRTTETRRMLVSFHRRLTCPLAA